MRNKRLILLALLVALLAFLAAGCGGDDDEEAGGDTAGSTDGGGGDVSGSITVLAVWTGAEGENFRAVLDGFEEENPDVTVRYQSAADPATVLRPRSRAATHRTSPRCPPPASWPTSPAAAR